MKSFSLRKHTLSGGVAVALLAGCGGSQPPVGAPGAMPQTSPIATHADRGKSWMLPEAKSGLYISEYNNRSDAVVLGYPANNRRNGPATCSESIR
jgi:hypothetical protein